MQLSDITNRTGIIELLEDKTNTQSATTSSYTRTTKIRDINNAYAHYLTLANQASGRWLADDTNQVDYPVITTNIVSSQQDYSFTVDEQGNQILDIYRVECFDSAGIAHKLRPFDMQDTEQALTEFMKNGGIPVCYDKTANGLILYPTPNYSYTNGLKIYYERTPSYFTVSGTVASDTKKPGIPDIHHEYLALRPAYQYCLQKGLSQASSYYNEMIAMESFIKEYYRDRNKDEILQIRTVYSSSQ